MRKIFQKIFIILVIGVFIFGISSADASPKFEASIERDEVSVGNPVYMYLSFLGDNNVSRPEISQVEGVRIQYIGPSSKTKITNGNVSKSITHTYLIIPMNEGEYKLGPYEIAFEGVVYKSNILKLKAGSVPKNVQGLTGLTSAQNQLNKSSPSITTNNSISSENLGDRVFLVMETNKEKIFLNEDISLTIKLYVTKSGLKDIEYPRYLHEGFSTSPFGEPEKRREIIRGITYDVLVFKQDLYGIKEGKYSVGPAILTCKVVVPRQTARKRLSYFDIDIDAFFGGNFGQDIYPVELKSNEIEINVLPFPDANKPENFQGAVGDYVMKAYIDKKKIKVGDPVVLHMEITGIGDLDTVNVPNFEKEEDLKTYDPEVVKEKNKKIFEQIFIPKAMGVAEIPEVSFTFFNPKKEKYETLKSGPFPIEVIESSEGLGSVQVFSLPQVKENFYPEEKFGKDIVYMKESIGKERKGYRFLYKNPLFLFLNAICFFLFVIFRNFYNKKDRMIRDHGYAKFIKAPRQAQKGLKEAKRLLDKGDKVSFCDAVFKTLQDYLANRLDIPKGNVSIEEVRSRIGNSNFDKEKEKILEDIFQKCEIVRYALGDTEIDGKEMLSNVKKVILYMEKIKI